MSAEQRRIEIAAHIDELAFLIDAVQDYAMFLLSPIGEIRSWNRGADRILGYTAKEAIGTHFSRLYTDEDLAIDKPGNELRTAASVGRVEDEAWRIRKDGSRFWANTVITAIRDEGGNLRGFAKVTRDLSERREAEERLRQSEEMFRLLVASVQDYAIFLLDPTGHVVTWNLGAERIKQYKASEIIGKHFSIFYPEQDKWKPPAELEIAKKEGRFEEEGWRLRKDGTRFWANVVITAIYDRHRVLRGFTKVTRDITARREAEETRRALLEQREARVQAEEEKRRAEASYRAAQEANRAKDEFLMTLSHELRTPMTAILGWSRMLPTMHESDPMFREAIRAIARSADLQAKLIDDVLDVSRIVSGKLRLTMEDVELVPVLQSALDAVRTSAAAKHITLTTAFDRNLGSATFDATRLHQVVWNLLSNAVKFTPDGGRVELAARRTPSHLQITVTDTGEGIDPEFLPHVFEPFRQAETPSTRVHGGLGLGLSIVRYLAEAHGGTITASSAGRGKGSQFTVIFPTAAVHPSIATASEPSEPEKPHATKFADLHGRQILLVDDDNIGREMIAAVLRRAGASVTAVDSAPKALEALETFKPHLIITDLAMPAMDGYALREKIRERHGLADIPVVALTAFPPMPMSVDEKVFDRYLRKPIDPFDLTEQVSQLLRPA
jgi:PAS domain S-box-containing protein